MSFVFVSHASPDKPRIKPIVDALLAEGFKVWLDNPAAAGFDENQIRQFFRIRAGGRWEDEIDEALRDCACVLVCWSSRAVTENALKLKERSVWFNEAYFAKTAGKMVACMVDVMNPADLPGTLSAQQLPDLNPDQADGRKRAVLVTVLDDVRRKIETGRDHKRQANTSRNVFAPYFANRREQEGIAQDAMTLAASQGGVRPLFIAGPDNERPDEFLARLRITSAEVLPDSKTWLELEAEWPIGVAPRVFAETYRRNIARTLRQSASDDAALAGELERKSRPVAILHRIMAREWGPDEPKRVMAWLEFWGALSASAPRAQIIPVLYVKMPAAKPGWKKCPSGGSGGRVSNRGIWNGAVRVTKNAKRAALQLAAAPILHPINHGDADRWLNRLFPEPGPEKTRAEQMIREVYRRGAPKRHGVCHEEFAELVAPLFDGQRSSGGGQ